MSVFISRRRLPRLLCLASLFCAATAHAKSPTRAGKSKDAKAWINAKGICVFPFAANKFPDTSDAFAAAMERGYRKALKLPPDTPVVTAAGGTYPSIEALRINVCDGVVRRPDEDGRKPADKQKRLPGVDAARFELLGNGLSVGDATLNMHFTATDARLLFTRDKTGTPLLVLDGAREGTFSAEMTHKNAERFLLAAARKGGGKYGLAVDRTKLKLTVEGGRTVRVNLKLFTRFALIPAGLDFLARLDIDDNFNGRVSELSCTGDDILGPLITGLIRPFLAKYNGTTRPLLSFATTNLHLRGIEITSDDQIRVAAALRSK